MYISSKMNIYISVEDLSIYKWQEIHFSDTIFKVYPLIINAVYLLPGEKFKAAVPLEPWGTRTWEPCCPLGY